MSDQSASMSDVTLLSFNQFNVLFYGYKLFGVYSFMNREETRYFGLCHEGSAHILVSFYHVKRVAIVEIFRRLSTGRYRCIVDYNDRVIIIIQYILKESFDAAGPPVCMLLSTQLSPRSCGNWQHYFFGTWHAFE